MSNERASIGWWELRVNGQVLTTIKGKESADWFLEQIQRADPLAHWELVAITKGQTIRPIGPDEIKKHTSMTGCVGSD